MSKSLLMAAAALSMMGSMQTARAETYDIPKRWAPSARSGNNKALPDMAKVKARKKMAAKSRRQQRRARR